MDFSCQKILSREKIVDHSSNPGTCQKEELIETPPADID